MALRFDVLAVAGAVVICLVAAHLIATGGTGTLNDPVRGQLAITPRTTLSHWWRHLWAGFFHNTWGHLVYNVALLAIAFPIAVRGYGPLSTAGTFLAIGPTVVLLLHLILVRPLAGAGVPYAVAAMDGPLVGFSVMAFATIGMALATQRIPVAFAIGAVIIVYEIVLARFITPPFVFAYHLGGLGAGFGVRRIMAAAGAP